jgi:hypothetical protein
MSSNNIERFEIVPCYGGRDYDRPDYEARSNPSGEYVRYSDHERIVKELEAKIEHLQGWQAGLMKTTVAWSEQGINSVSLPDAISVVEGMRDEWLAKRNEHKPLTAKRNRYDAGFCAANEILTRLRVLSPGVAGEIEDRPRIVCLCGSTRFANEFMQAQFAETVAGKIVLTVGCFPRKPDGSWDRMQVTDKQKIHLDALHFRKIELADEVFVIDVGGYIGESTRNEINHALKLGKPIRYRSEELHRAATEQSTEEEK